MRADDTPLTMAGLRNDCRESASWMLSEDASRKQPVTAGDLEGKPRAWYDRAQALIWTLTAAERDHNDVCRGFAKIYLRAHRDQNLSMGGLQQVYARMPGAVPINHLADVAFFGLINPATIYHDRAALQDLLAVIVTIGLANLAGC